uniref:Tetratricopeptide repeat protein n=1 Tax=Salvator merianae TaxID=96440 RepID=A0A8D0KDN4_SALMN
MDPRKSSSNMQARVKPCLNFANSEDRLFLRESMESLNHSFSLTRNSICEADDEPLEDASKENVWEIWNDETEHYQNGTEEVGYISDEIRNQISDKNKKAFEVLAKGELQKALDLFTEVIELNPHVPSSYVNRANVFMQLQEPNEALKDCNIAIELDPKSVESLRLRGKAFKNLGRLRAAACDLALLPVWSQEEISVLQVEIHLPQ